ncbi:U4/U6.U5 small nuclear ribonucleoprotein 27 kDa protein [Lasiodiplodia hormozganensis]|uniref:U4/U6.U5 small nuclear ribonucleoprotein 27 kDa protein n=1 Tax=Lasiodiplodia hormozganensis TaxID=869390 RepID=A0AA39YWA5_9PEZI|nr:U4/U6.U5 small nuclear ribonucleoprotein 27 kDa protein [Lasiodiplodia hormozganensis]
MPEPPASKRSRRPDSAQMWDDDDRGKQQHSRRGGGGGARHRSRSPRDRDHEGGGGHSRRGGRRDRSGSRERGGRRRDDRARSRSPRPSDGNVRRRSPPRGPRGPPAAATTNGAKKGGAAAAAATELPPTAGRTQPSSREWTRRVQSRVGTSVAGGMTNGDKDGNDMDVDGGAGAVDPETREMERLMGFSSFSSTHNTKVPGNDRNYAVRKEKKTEYRQYMNRVGGFNRPLSPSR